MHPDKLKVHISKLLACQHFDNLSNFLHALREAQRVHLKAFGFSALRTFQIFLMHPDKLKAYVSKLLALQLFDNLSNFSHAPRQAQSAHLKAFGFSALRTFPIFLLAPREAQSVHLKAFGFSALRTFPIFFMHPEKLKVYISKLLAFQHFSTLRTFPIFLMHPEKLKAYISKLLAFQHCSTLRTFPIFLMHRDKLKVYISKLLAF